MPSGALLDRQTSPFALTFAVRRALGDRWMIVSVQPNGTLTGAIDAAGDIGDAAATRVRNAVQGTIRGVKVVLKTRLE